MKDGTQETNIYRKKKKEYYRNGKIGYLYKA